MTEQQTQAEQNKAFVRRTIAEAWNQGDLNQLEEIVDVSHVDYGRHPEEPSGPEGRRQQIAMYRTAFPDFEATVEEQLAEGDKVVTRWTFRGTHSGALNHPRLGTIPPSGKVVMFSGLTVSHIVGGKIADSWTIWDRVGLLQQLGVVPAPGQAKD